MSEIKNTEKIIAADKTSGFNNESVKASEVGKKLDANRNKYIENKNPQKYKHEESKPTKSKHDSNRSRQDITSRLIQPLGQKSRSIKSPNNPLQNIANSLQDTISTVLQPFGQKSKNSKHNLGKSAEKVSVTDKPGDFKSRGSESSEVNKNLVTHSEKYLKNDEKKGFKYGVSNDDPKRNKDISEQNSESNKADLKKGNSPEQKAENNNGTTWIDELYKQRDKKDKAKEKNYDKLLHVSNFDKARVEAFEKAGLKDSSKIVFGEEDPKTGTVVEFRGPKGAKVVYDAPHPDKNPKFGHDKPHIGFQTAGKKSFGGRERGNITYEGPQHPHISHKDEENL